MWKTQGFGGIVMKVSYKKLWVILAHKEISKADLRKNTGISPTTFTKINRNEIVALTVLIKICLYLDCEIGDIIEIVRD